MLRVAVFSLFLVGCGSNSDTGEEVGVNCFDVPLTYGCESGLDSCCTDVPVERLNQVECWYEHGDSMWECDGMDCQDAAMKAVEALCSF